MPDLSNYTYSTVPRRCGGSHTLTYPYRRTRLQHLSQGLYAPEEIQVAMKVRMPPAGVEEGPSRTLIISCFWESHQLSLYPLPGSGPG